MKYLILRVLLGAFAFSANAQLPQHFHDAVTLSVNWQNLTYTVTYNPNLDDCFEEWTETVFDQEAYTDCRYACERSPNESGLAQCYADFDNNNYYSQVTMNNISFFQIQLRIATIDGPHWPSGSGTEYYFTTPISFNDGVYLTSYSGDL